MEMRNRKLDVISVICMFGEIMIAYAPMMATAKQAVLSLQAVPRDDA